MDISEVKKGQKVSWNTQFGEFSGTVKMIVRCAKPEWHFVVIRESGLRINVSSLRAAV